LRENTPLENPPKTSSARYAVAGKRPVVYWDTNVYIDWLNKARDGTPEGEGIAFWYDLIVAHEAVLVYSQILWLEVSPLNVGPVAFATFERFVTGFGTSWPIDRTVINEAVRLREQSIGFRKSGADDTVICVPDAIHLATANLAECGRFFTFDREGRYGCFGLLPFDGRLAGFTPRIRQPAVDPSARPRRHVPSLAEVLAEHPNLFGREDEEEGAHTTEQPAEVTPPEPAPPEPTEQIDLSELTPEGASTGATESEESGVPPMEEPPSPMRLPLAAERSRKEKEVGGS
jgi:predicted nucleic acid-binding protein